jgi:site-specific DNA-methyltransferase (adenine-specific)
MMPKIELLQGDCLEVMKDLPDGSIDLVLTDPPYGTTACKWDSVIPLEPMWEQLKRVTKKKGAIVLTASQPFTSALIMSNVNMFKYDWIWVKTHATGHLNAWRRPMRQHEDILVFSGGSPTYTPQIEDKPKQNQRPVPTRTKLSDCYGMHKLNAHRCPPDKSMPRSIVTFANRELGQHPTQKPVALMEYLIKTYTNEGETVLDFTMGSGTTGVACKNLNRNFIGIELDSEYFEIAKKRITEEITEEKAQLGFNFS